MTALVSERTENCIKEPSPDKERFLVSLLHTVTNLAANEQNQTEMRVSVATMYRFDRTEAEIECC